MPIDKFVEDLEGGLAKAQQYLATLDQGIRTLSGATRDVNDRPAASGGSLVDQVQGTLTNVQRAAQLRQMLPWVFVAGGILLGRPLLGIALAIVVHLAGQEP